MTYIIADHGSADGELTLWVECVESGRGYEVVYNPLENSSPTPCGGNVRCTQWWDKGEEDVGNDRSPCAHVLAVEEWARNNLAISTLWESCAT